ncbi:hypothetical protein BASA81_001694 [Batrachochytrium salamandrivorans]|nr:hypothetical protein BASA81_001694 [Batrachochytrium salamandrivorans]
MLVLPSSSSPSSSSPSKRTKLAPTKSVSFASSCKLHDGLTTRKYLYERVIQEFFFHRMEISELYILQLVEYDAKQMVELCGDFKDLGMRMKREIVEEPRLKQHVPVLPRGGGAALRLFEDHYTYVVLLCRVVEAAMQRLLRGMPAPPPPSTQGPTCVDLDFSQDALSVVA